MSAHGIIRHCEDCGKAVEDTDQNPRPALCGGCRSQRPEESIPSWLTDTLEAEMSETMRRIRNEREREVRESFDD